MLTTEGVGGSSMAEQVRSSPRTSKIPLISICLWKEAMFLEMAGCLEI